VVGTGVGQTEGVEWTECDGAHKGDDEGIATIRCGDVQVREVEQKTQIETSVRDVIGDSAVTPLFEV
jgi:hypothetical protein